MIVTAFRAEHLEGSNFGAELSGAQKEWLERFSWTALADEKVLACAGVVPIWQGRYAAWAYLAPDSGPWMRRITKAVRAYLVALDARRVEMSVEIGFKQGHQWARMLGFALETERMPAYAPDGADHAMYVRVRT